MRPFDILVATLVIGSCMQATPGRKEPSPPELSPPFVEPSPASATPTREPGIVTTPPLPPVLEIVASAFVGTSDAWVVERSTSTRLRYTGDAGATWQDRAVPDEVAYVVELRFIDQRNGWLLGHANRGGQYGCAHAAPPGVPPCRLILYSTSDGGRSWTGLYTEPDVPGIGHSLKEMQFIDTTQGWILRRTDPCDAGELPFNCYDLLATTDGGRGWRAVQTRMNARDLQFLDRHHGWALVTSAGTHTTDAIATADGGLTWHVQIRGEPLLMLSVPNVGVAMALSRHGGYCTASMCLSHGLFRVAGGRLETVHPTKPTSWFAASPSCGGLVRDLFFLDERRGWIGLVRGAGGVSSFNPAGLLATTDGGATWSCVNSFSSQDVVSVRFADRARGWAITQAHTPNFSIGTVRLWRTDDGGLSWRLVLS